MVWCGVVWCCAVLCETVGQNNAGWQEHVILATLILANRSATGNDAIDRVRAAIQS